MRKYILIHVILALFYVPHAVWLYAKPEEAERVVHKVDLEDLILALTNGVRKQHGLKPLQYEGRLREVARHHSTDMIRRKFFDHKNPDGLSPADRIARGHRTLIGTSGENIWQIQSQKTYTTRALAKQSMVNWMASPGHRANILKPDYTHLGVGVSMVRGKVTITQNFSGTAAYLDQALPKEIKRGEHLNFTMTSFGSFKPNAEYYEYWHEHKNERKSESIPIDNRQVNIKKGKYRLWFYFREKNSLWPEPVVEVR
jgi:hypothetical protein